MSIPGRTRAEAFERRAKAKAARESQAMCARAPLRREATWSWKEMRRKKRERRSFLWESQAMFSTWVG